MNEVKETKRSQRKETLSYTVEVTDKEGRVLQRISAPSRSYVQQWNQIINVCVAMSDGKLIKDTQGNDRSMVSGWLEALAANAAIGFTSGLRVGKGSTAVAIDDYALETPLGEGTGTDEFNHQAVVFTEPSVVGPTCSFTIQRVMINNSGATITGIRELGCYVKYYSSGVRYAMAFRDVLPSAVYVPHGGSITVTYTIKVTV